MSEQQPESYEAPTVEEIELDDALMEPAGIEPATSALQRRRSAS
jgi:hypothetical protein